MNGGAEHEDDRLEELSEETAAEGVLQVISLGASVIPLAGSFLAAVSGSASADRKFGRLIEHQNNIIRLVNQIDEELDHDYIREDEFQELFEETLDAVLNERSAERRNYMASLLVHDARSGGVGADFDTKSRYVRLISEFSPTDIRVLRTLTIVRDDSRSSSADSYTAAICRRDTAIDREELPQAFRSLQREGLVVEGVMLGGGITSQATDNMSGLITSDGIRFITFITQGE